MTIEKNLVENTANHLKTENSLMTTAINRFPYYFGLSGVVSLGFSLPNIGMDMLFRQQPLKEIFRCIQGYFNSRAPGAAFLGAFPKVYGQGLYQEIYGKKVNPLETARFAFFYGISESVVMSPLRIIGLQSRLKAEAERTNQPFVPLKLASLQNLIKYSQLGLPATILRNICSLGSLVTADQLKIYFALDGSTQEGKALKTLLEFSVACLFSFPANLADRIAFEQVFRAISQQNLGPSAETLLREFSKTGLTRGLGGAIFYLYAVNPILAGSNTVVGLTFDTSEKVANYALTSFFYKIQEMDCFVESTKEKLNKQFIRFDIHGIFARESVKNVIKAEVKREVTSALRSPMLTYR